MKDSWVVRCSGATATVTWKHTFPRNAVVGTRGMREYWAFGVRHTSWGRFLMIGRTLHQTVKVRRFSTVRFTQIQWGWKTK